MVCLRVFPALHDGIAQRNWIRFGGHLPRSVLNRFALGSPPDLSVTLTPKTSPCTRVVWVYNFGEPPLHLLVPDRPGGIIFLLIARHTNVGPRVMRIQDCVSSRRFPAGFPLGQRHHVRRVSRGGFGSQSAPCPCGESECFDRGERTESSFGRPNVAVSTAPAAGRRPPRLLSLTPRRLRARFFLSSSRL